MSPQQKVPLSSLLLGFNRGSGDHRSPGGGGSADLMVLFCLLEMNIRNGTDVDAAIAMKTFSQLGYKVQVANDQTVQNMHQLMSSGEETTTASSSSGCFSWPLDWFSTFFSSSSSPSSSWTSVGSFKLVYSFFFLIS